MRLDPAAGSITVRTWSPTRRSALRDQANHFTIRGLDLGARAASNRSTAAP